MARTEYNREWRARNREHVNAGQRQARAKHPERYKGYDKKYYDKKTPEQITAEVRKKMYGIDASDWEKLFNKQGRCCAICKATEPGGNRPWHTDHCHKTGPVRGILCKRCNMVLGFVKDDVELLKKLVAYLRRFTPA